ncbi:TetR family transcriptional regulator [Aeromicrobium sp. Root495]|uniref:TetR/AcrR family transcriptional regulator n=1 Tax=Aeromicrobium sp. Root495 TaxID=1736550 RepID=UPI0006FB0CAE|nr:TetR/AcrR family transcriptional regulator [Aeromicrobium sp. Root495]KQY59893.1 TetR family transcriptional regulator [Aeromicrobium sp. Root495]
MTNDTDASTQPSRALRADARRNRDAILAAAREVFETEGVLAPLDGIAVRAGVGNATLYRNFPVRDDLLAAVLRANVEEALTESDTFARDLPAKEALSEWLFHLVWQLRIWHDLPYCVATAQGDPDSSMNSATNPLLLRTDALLDAAKASGTAHPDITAAEVFELATTLSWGLDRFHDDRDAARRRVRIGTAGVFV